MKKIFTLALGSMLMLAASAADKKPSVTVNAPKKYEIVIDGRTIQTGDMRVFNDGRGYQSTNSVNIPFLRDGRHTVQVYQLSKGIFMKRKVLVASSSFQMRNKDIAINVDVFGNLKISESRSRYDWNGKDWGNGRDNDRDDHNQYDKSIDQSHGKRF